MEEAEKILAIGQPATRSIPIHDLPPNTPYLVETVDAAHGFAVRAWQAMGQPNRRRLTNSPSFAIWVGIPGAKSSRWTKQDFCVSS